MTASGAMTVNADIAEGGDVVIQLLAAESEEVLMERKLEGAMDGTEMPVFDSLPKLPFRLRVSFNNAKLYAINL